MDTLLLKRFCGILLITILISYAFFVRVFNLGEQSLWIDEGYSIHGGEMILAKGYPLLPSLEIYKNGIFHTYLTALSLLVSTFDPFTPWEARIPAALFGVGVIIATYTLAQELFKKHIVSILSAFIVSFSYWEIAWSRQARGFTMVSFFILLLLLYAKRYGDTGIRKNLFYSVVFALGAYLSHGVSVVVFPFVGTYLAYHICKKHISCIREFSSYGVGLLTILCTGIAGFVFEMTRYSGYPSLYMNFMLNEMTLFSLGLVGIIVLSYSNYAHKKSLSYLASVCMCSLFVIFTYSQTVQFRYIFPLFPLLVISLTYTVHAIYEHICKQREILRISLTCITLIGCTWSYLSYIPLSTYALELGSPQPNFKSAYYFINTNKKNGDILLSPYTQLNSIYLRDNGYWLPMSLTGKPEEIERKIVDDADYYTGAPIIHSIEELRDTLNTKHGFIVIDSMARIRLPNEVELIENHPRTNKVFEDVGPVLNSVTVFYFGNTMR